MRKKLTLKMILFNIGFVLVEIALFSEGFLGLGVSDQSITKQAAAITIVVMSLILFVYMNYSFLSSKSARYKLDMDELDEPTEFVDALATYSYKSMFRETIEAGQDQVKRLEKKMHTLDAVLFQNYKTGIDDYSGFRSVVDDSRQMLYDNLKKVINAMEIVDHVEYSKVMNTNWSAGQVSESSVMQSKKNMYQGHINYIQRIMDFNEEILLEFDKLLMEATRMNNSSVKGGDIEDLRNIITSLENLNDGTDKEFRELESKYMNQL